MDETNTKTGGTSRVNNSGTRPEAIGFMAKYREIRPNLIGPCPYEGVKRICLVNSTDRAGDDYGCVAQGQSEKAAGLRHVEEHTTLVLQLI